MTNNVLNETALQKNLIFSLSHAVKITYSMYLAFEMGVFTFIANNDSVDIRTLCKSLNIPERSCQALLSMCSSIGLLECDSNSMYSLADSTRYFLLPESDLYLGDLMNLNLLNKNTIFSYDAFKQAVITGSSQVYAGRELFEVNATETEKTLAFTKAMHAKSAAAALFWPNVLNLSDHKTFLDIGGGSGAHVIEAIRNWPHLAGIIYDQPLVCEIAKQFVQKAHLEQKISVHSGDMWSDPFPSADIHFYCDIFHDWSQEKNQFLVDKSYASLPRGGKIVIHELLFDNNKAGPLDVSMCNMSMLMWTEGQQLSQNEVSMLLTRAGFQDITISNTGFSSWSITIGTKS